ncbi:MAG: glutamine--fructose-6-phosphate transaminase (isomerizing) [Planctomycetota bacterium]
MCGIAAVVGLPDAARAIFGALERLTYRGYDSAGIVTLSEGKAHLLRRSGKIGELGKALDYEPLPGETGMGHTRWATHGAPTESNAHPHADSKGRHWVICNGIIENFRDLKAGLAKKGVTFKSQTDTEVLPMLLESYGNLPLRDKVLRLLKEITGSFAMVIMDVETPEEIWAARMGSPILVARGGGAHFLASDVPAVLAHCKEVAYLNDGDLVCLKKGGIDFMNFAGKPMTKVFEKIDYTLEQARKEGYAHFMLKEIREQPAVVERTLKTYLGPKGVDFEGHIDPAILDGIEEILFIACGTAYHAGLVGQYLAESLGLRSRACVASEFHPFPPPLGPKTLVVAVTQSGETIDTLYAMRRAKQGGARTLAICNVKGATIVREADAALMMQAGPEIGVASTKAYSTMLAVIALLVPEVAARSGTLPPHFHVKAHHEALRDIPGKMSRVLEGYPGIKALVGQFTHFNDYFYIARGFNLPTALEGALKLKEITYLHAEGYSGGEMKHGPIALVDPKLLIVAVAPKDGTEEKMGSNIEEVRARGGKVFLITSEDSAPSSATADWTLSVPTASRETLPLLTVLPLQILAYEAAVARGTDPDQPRNLAKSVTVE